MPVQRKQYDILFSEIIRSIGRCEAEGYDERPCSPQLQCAHIVTRKRSATRTDFRNAFCLCHAHHRWFTDYPRQFSRFISNTWAQEYYDDVYQRSITPTKINWKDRIDFLKDIKRAISGGEMTLEEARKYEE